MADSASTGGDPGVTDTRSITATSSSQSRASSALQKSRPASSTSKRKGSASTTTVNSSITSLFTTSTGVGFAKGVGSATTDQGTVQDISSRILPATSAIPAPSSSSNDIPNDTDAEIGGTLSPGIITAVVLGTVVVILLPIMILCLRRRRTVDRTQRTRWWKRRRPVSQGYDDNPFSSDVEFPTPTPTPTPTPQWATGSHVYRPGDPPIPPEEDDLYFHTLKSKLALDSEHTRTTCVSAASTVSHDSIQRSSPAQASQPSLPMTTRTGSSRDAMLSSSLSLPASHRSRTISLKPICLSDYPPIPPLPKSPPPPPPPFPRVRRAESYVFVMADPDPFNDPSEPPS